MGERGKSWHFCHKARGNCAVDFGPAQLGHQGSGTLVSGVGALVLPPEAGASGSRPRQF